MHSSTWKIEINSKRADVLFNVNSMCVVKFINKNIIYLLCTSKNILSMVNTTRIDQWQQSQVYLFLLKELKSP